VASHASIRVPEPGRIRRRKNGHKKDLHNAGVLPPRAKVAEAVSNNTRIGCCSVLISIAASC